MKRVRQPVDPVRVSPRLRRVLFVAVAVVILLSLARWFFDFGAVQFRVRMGRQIARALESGRDTGTISLDECVPFRWDRAVFVGPYERPERVSKLLCAKVSKEDVKELLWDDSINGFVFLTGTEVRLETFGRQGGRLDGVSRTRVFTPGRFKIAYRIVREPGRSPEFMFDDRADGK